MFASEAFSAREREAAVLKAGSTLLIAENCTVALRERVTSNSGSSPTHHSSTSSGRPGVPVSGSRVSQRSPLLTCSQARGWMSRAPSTRGNP